VPISWPRCFSSPSEHCQGHTPIDVDAEHGIRVDELKLRRRPANCSTPTPPRPCPTCPDFALPRLQKPTVDTGSSWSLRFNIAPVPPSTSRSSSRTRRRKNGRTARIALPNFLGGPIARGHEEALPRFCLVSDARVPTRRRCGLRIPSRGQRAKSLARGKVIMAGYYNDNKATERALHSGWFHTGDAAVVHPDGYIEIRDRLKDVIISGRENISSVEVEGVLLRRPAVREVAIVGLRHERWGEAPHASCRSKRRADRRGRAPRICAGEHRAFQGATQGHLHQRTSQDRDRKDSEIHFERSIERYRSAVKYSRLNSVSTAPECDLSPRVEIRVNRYLRPSDRIAPAKAQCRPASQAADHRSRTELSTLQRKCHAAGGP
jgi:hypothetical protein